MIKKIISGGQTGADRAALDFAIMIGFPHGGWCPRGRRAEDGAIDPKYALTESPDSGYMQRTEWNVRDSDGTVIMSLAARLTGGSLKTLEFAVKHRKPHLHIWAADEGAPGEKLTMWVEENRVKVLNIAGPRSSKEPAVAAFILRVLEEASSLWP